MLKTTAIGYLGADAEVKNENGKEFTTMRLAHTNKCTDANGVTHEETIWVDCIMNGSGKVNEFLKKGQLVYVTGSTKLRIYSSQKDRCMKEGLTINVSSIELLGSKTDDVPSVLYKEDDGEQVELRKFYHCSKLVREETAPESIYLVSKGGQRFRTDRKGWVYAEQNDPQNVQQ